jgi:CRISPR-associated protein Csc3
MRCCIGIGKATSRLFCNPEFKKGAATMYDDAFDPDENNDFVLEELPEVQAKPRRVALAPQPLFQALFMQSIPAQDTVLQDFARCIVGQLSDHFALKAAKGGAFFRQKEAEGAENTERYQRDQSLRAHLINGMLPALHIARYLHQWHAPNLRDWDDTTERLFIAGYMLHDFTKIKAAQQTLLDAGFAEGEAPSMRQIPTLETIFQDWCGELGIDTFLQPIGGAEKYLHDLIYIACNTQQLWGTAQAPSLLPKKATDVDVYSVATIVSRLADLLAYVAATPRDVVAHKSIRKIITIDLGENTRLPNKSVAQLVYHHVAENRGVLLNFIHNAVINALTDERRVPLLYAPSGVVYLQRHDAPDMPYPAEITAKIVDEIRGKAGQYLIDTGKGAKRGNTGFQADDSYNDFFGLREMLLASPALIQRHIRNNKSPDRIGKLQSEGWADLETIPAFPIDAKDARVDKIAEWAGFIENQYRDRLNETNVAPLLLEALNITDLTEAFYTVRNRVKDSGKSGGIQLWWFWAAAHALNRRPGMDEVAVLEWLHHVAQGLAQVLPEDLPATARVNDATWQDLMEYVSQVLTVGGAKSTSAVSANELTRYTRAKSGRGGSVCTLCGSDYVTRKPAETAVSFQPGVYTGRIRVGASDNKRNLCSICALEQLLRQLFVNNLDTGSNAESQRIRYLSFYPSYFFTPETLRFVQRAYDRIKAVRISDKDLWAALREAGDLRDANFWQRLEAFLLRPENTSDDAKFRRIVSYSKEAQGTFLNVGFRNIDPTETESWVLPALLALVFSVCLDVKVVASDSSVPLLLESGELPETVWLDGAHAAIQAITGIEKDPKNPERWRRTNSGHINIDALGMAIARLTAAYLIHLDTERDKPGKGKGDEHWSRFGPIAHALMESPLYVFHYLKHQERDERPVNYAKIVRYISYVKLFNDQEDKLMTDAEKLVELYRRFYRAKRWKNSNSVLRPLSVVADALLVAAINPSLVKNDEELFMAARSGLFAFMKRVGKGQADGYPPKDSEAADREQAMDEFCRYFVNNVFITRFNRDAGKLRGKEFNLVRDGCDYMYRRLQQEEFNLKGKDLEIDETDDDDSAEA